MPPRSSKKKRGSTSYEHGVIILKDDQGFLGRMYKLYEGKDGKLFYKVKGEKFPKGNRKAYSVEAAKALKAAQCDDKSKVKVMGPDGKMRCIKKRRASARAAKAARGGAPRPQSEKQLARQAMLREYMAEHGVNLKEALIATRKGPRVAHEKKDRVVRAKEYHRPRSSPKRA